MKNLFVSALIFATLSTSAFAAKKAPMMTDQKVKSLISRLQAKVESRKKKFSKLDTKIVRFFLSPAQPKQGENVVVFAQIASRFLDSDTFLEASFDSNPVSLEKSAVELWAYDAGVFSEIGDHTFTATIFIQDTAAATEIKNAIAALDSAIAALNDQIDQETDENTRNQLIAQRDLKISQKMELIAALDGLKKSIASESITFSIAENPSAPGFPYINSLSPRSGSASGGIFVTVQGVNFVEGMEGTLGGTPVSLNFDSPTQLSFSTPSFLGAEGPKDLIIRTPGPDVKNAVRKNAFYAVPDLVGNSRPVAVPGPSQTIALGNSAAFNGTASYDDNGHNFSFAWTPISVPEGSNVQIGEVFTYEPQFDFTPNKPGHYVWQLVVSEFGTDQNLISEPALTVLTVDAPANSAPQPSADAITVVPEGTVTRQIDHGDADDYQAHSYLITKQSALGTATISSSGLISFTATSTSGSDSIEVAVFDNGNPPLSGSVSIPVTVAISEVTVGAIVHDVVSNDGIIRVGFFAEPISSSNGEIVSVMWTFGDGTSGPSDETIQGVDTYVQHDYMGPGTYPVTLTATDSLGATFTQNYNLVLGDTDVPVGRLSVDTISGAVPLTVNFDASASTSVSPITRYQWRWADGSPNQNEIVPTASHTFTEPGHYRVRLIVTNEARGRSGDSYVDIYAGIAPPLEGSRPVARFDLGAVEVTLGSPHLFDGSWSFDPNPLGSIASYNWTFDDWATCGGVCNATGINPSYTFPQVGNFWSHLVVTGSAGAISGRVDRQVIVVNSGHAPRAVLKRPLDNAPLEGVAPFTVNFDGTHSFDYDGSITNYYWHFGDSNCTTNCESSSAVTAHTFNEPGEYWIGLTVTDNDGNTYSDGIEISVSSNAKITKQNTKKKRFIDRDPERERKKRMLAHACSKNHAPACYEVGKMHEEDGNQFAATKYFEKACALGSEAACSVGK